MRTSSVLLSEQENSLLQSRYYREQLVSEKPSEQAYLALQKPNVSPLQELYVDEEQEQEESVSNDHFCCDQTNSDQN